MIEDNRETWIAAVEAATLKPRAEADLGDLAAAQQEIDAMIANVASGECLSSEAPQNPMQTTANASACTGFSFNPNRTISAWSSAPIALRSFICEKVGFKGREGGSQQAAQAPWGGWCR